MRAQLRVDRDRTRLWALGCACVYDLSAQARLSHQCHGRTQEIADDNNDMVGQDLPRGNGLYGADMLYTQGTCASGKADLRSALQEEAPWDRCLVSTGGKVLYSRETWCRG